MGPSRKYLVGISTILQLSDAERTYSRAPLGLATAQIQQHKDPAGLFVTLGGARWGGPAAAPSPRWSEAGDAPGSAVRS
jgi:outer membrane protein TolC